MIKLLVKIFVKNPENTKDSKVRESYGVLGGVLGIICNLILFAVKLIIGLSVKALAVTSDAFNNLTDSFSSIVSIISAKLSGKKPDKDHPFGHGRIEYISTMIVAFVIIMVGISLLKSSASKLLVGLGLIEGSIDPLASGTMLIVSIVILCASLLVKLWMFSFNKYLGKKIDSAVLLATSKDSISDVLTSSSIIIATVIGAFLLKENYFYLDAIMGIAVSVVICINGIKIVLETIGTLLGKPAEKEDIDAISNVILSDKTILGIHDLIIHNYGPGCKFASVHAEVSADCNIVETHEIIDGIEQKCYAKTGIQLTVHMDPIDFSSPDYIKAKEAISHVLSSYKDISFHDLRITDGKENINIIFDIVVPHEYDNTMISSIISAIKVDVKKINPIYSVVVNIDRPFVE